VKLFLDANILLDFYRFGDDDITEMGKLVALLEGGELELYVNDHLKNEVIRNREKVIAESFPELQATKYKVRTPNYCSKLPELAELRDALRTANEAHNRLVRALGEKISANDLPADHLITSIFRNAAAIELSSDILDRAQLRMSLANPPGKVGSLGDALHWECLLTIDSGYGMRIVSRDGDFASELRPKEIKVLLSREWAGHFGKGASIKLYKSLSEFFRDEFPDIRISDEAAKNELISQLRLSPNFATTHSIVADLSQFKFFTNSQVRSLFEILVENTQVGWIASDADLQEFYFSLQSKSYVVPNEIQDVAASLLEVQKDDFFLPF